MAEKKITDLPESSHIRESDFVEFVDTNSNTSKKIMLENVARSISHGDLGGLTTANDHPQYALIDHAHPQYAIAAALGVWRAWTPTFTGWSSVNTYVARYCVVGKMVHFILGMSDGVSNATNAEITLPVGMKNNGVPAVAPVGIAFDNGILVSSTTRWQINHTAPTILEFRLNGSNVGWTASGTKRFFCEGFYEAE